MIETEVWKPIAGYEGFYSVSNFGVVRSEARMVVRPAGNNYWTEAKIMRPSHGARSQYPIVRLAKNGSAKTAYVHHLVLDAFAGSRPEGCEACHCDGNRKNNASSNLRWDTRKGNFADKKLHGTDPIGDRHPMAKLSHQQVCSMRIRKQQGASVDALAIEFNVSRTAAHRASTGRSWSHIK